MAIYTTKKITNFDHGHCLLYHNVLKLIELSPDAYGQYCRRHLSDYNYRISLMKAKVNPILDYNSTILINQTSNMNTKKEKKSRLPWI